MQPCRGRGPATSAISEPRPAMPACSMCRSWRVRTAVFRAWASLKAQIGSRSSVRFASNPRVQRWKRSSRHDCDLSFPASVPSGGDVLSGIEDEISGCFVAVVQFLRVRRASAGTGRDVVSGRAQQAIVLDFYDKGLNRRILRPPRNISGPISSTIRRRRTGRRASGSSWNS